MRIYWSRRPGSQRFARELSSSWTTAARAMPNGTKTVTGSAAPFARAAEAVRLAEVDGTDEVVISRKED